MHIDQRIREIIREFNLPEAMADQVVLIVRLVLEKLEESTVDSDAYASKKYSNDIDDLVVMIRSLEQGEPLPPDSPIVDDILITIAAYVLLTLRNRMELEEITQLLKNQIHGTI
jgi:hypothetical protein